MKLYRLTRTDTGATLIVCAKSPVAARKVAMKHGEAWASATITKIQHFKPSGSTERVVLGPLVETQEESDEPDEEPDAPEISTMQAVEKLASVAADWLIVNADTVRLLVQRVRGA